MTDIEALGTYIERGTVKVEIEGGLVILDITTYDSSSRYMTPDQADVLARVITEKAAEARGSMPGAEKVTSEKFRQQLAALRLAAGRPSLREIADRAGVSHSTVAALLNGTLPVSWTVTSASVSALGGDPGDFLDLGDGS